MCCFSYTNPVGLLVRLFTPPVRVSSTQIFARMVSPGVQGLAYSMNLSTKDPIAMILPLPVVPGSGDEAVTFVDLEKHANMFEQLHMAFMMPQRKGGVRLFGSRGEAMLTVHAIGSFVASYVPTRGDFARLDPRFRMPERAWDDLPGYADYGFAVFQLAPGKTTIHPMGMTFPTREPEKLFFPTVHVHDGTVKKRAKFDHALYYQTPEVNVNYDEQAFGGVYADYAGLANVDWKLARRKLRGRRPNADFWAAI